MIRVFSEYRGVTGIHREKYWALLGHTGIEERGQKEGGVRPPLVRIGQGMQPPFPCSSPPLFFSPTPTREGGVLRPVGVGLPPWGALLLGRPPPPLLLYIRGQGGTPETQQLIIDLLAECGAPSTILHLDNIVVVLR